MRHENPQARDVAQKELREVLASTEALLAALGDQGGEAIDELRGRLTSTICGRQKGAWQFIRGERARKDHSGPRHRDVSERLRDGEAMDIGPDRRWSRPDCRNAVEGLTT